MNIYLSVDVLPLEWKILEQEGFKYVDLLNNKQKNQ